MRFRGRPARACRTRPSLHQVDSPARHAAIYDVTFAGHGGDPIKGWLLDPHRGGTQHFLAQLAFLAGLGCAAAAR
jgi:cephalosporin-C deacetylase-like acetyl esterase